MMAPFQRELAAWVLAPALILSLSGCASLTRLAHNLIGRPQAHAVAVTPVLTASDPAAAAAAAKAPADRLYSRATDAIRARRYADALDLLQYAREAAPEDVRVLNALGVVYDKLGRFDLSGRYYALALQRDPASTVVAANVAYSQTLQARSRTDLDLRQADPVVTDRQLAAREAAPASPAPFVLAASTVTPVRAEPLLTGQAMMVLNATGRPLGQEPTRRYLAEAGWSVRGAEAPVQASSEIRYAAKFLPVAKALARTLPFPTRLAACSEGCAGVQLVLGRDAPRTLKRMRRERSS